MSIEHTPGWSAFVDSEIEKTWADAKGKGKGMTHFMFHHLRSCKVCLMRARRFFQWRDFQCRVFIAGGNFK
jgi:hypothetical protein